jgi:hypothetical protein
MKYIIAKTPEDDAIIDALVEQLADLLSGFDAHFSPAGASNIAIALACDLFQAGWRPS